MKLTSRQVLMEYQDDSWYFSDGHGNRVKFDQAVVDATTVSKGRVVGFVVSVHGIAQEDAQHFDSKTRNDLGIRGVHSMGRGPTLKRVRLSPGNKVSTC